MRHEDSLRSWAWDYMESVAIARGFNPDRDHVTYWVSEQADALADKLVDTCTDFTRHVPEIPELLPTVEPRFTHDCDACTFLGFSRDDQADAYYCAQGDVYPTVILRTSDDGPDYSSGLTCISALHAAVQDRVVRLIREDFPHFKFPSGLGSTV
jgi:hypothetical protein